jgi:benzodiazapine receptor
MTKLLAANSSGESAGNGQYPALIVFVVLCFSAAAIGGFFPPDGWYASLSRPTYAPPNWVFGPVWTLLYLMIAVAGWRVWKSNVSAGKRFAFTMFGIQLLLNAAWSAIFFGWHKPDWALLEMGILWLAILTTIVLFKRHSLTAALLLPPPRC